MQDYSYKIPIAIPAFNRPDFLEKVLGALRNCTGIEDFFIVTSEEPDQGSGVHELFESIDWIEVKRHINKKVLKCAYNVPQVVTLALSYSDRVIVLEDDILPSKDMLKYHQILLNEFRKDERILSITAYCQNKVKPSKEDLNVIEESYYFTCWGWSTWKDRWDNFISDYSPQTSSWAREFNLYRQKNKMLEIRPKISRCNNIGIRGTHVLNENWQRTHQYTPYTSDDHPNICTEGFQLKTRCRDQEEGIITIGDESYSRGNCIGSKEMQIDQIKYFCKGLGAKISASANQVADTDFDPLDNSIDFPYIGFQKGQYGPFENKSNLIDFYSNDNMPNLSCDFLLIANVLEHCIRPDIFIKDMLNMINPSGIIFFELFHMYRRFGNFRKLTSLSEFESRHFKSKREIFYCEKQINFWIPETFIEILDSIKAKLQIEYVEAISAHQKDRFSVVIKKI